MTPQSISLLKRWFWSLCLVLNAESAETFRFSINYRDFYQASRYGTKLILESQNGYHLNVFWTKQSSFQDSSINHLRCLWNYLFPHILASFWVLNDFIINFIAKNVNLDAFSPAELNFSKNSANTIFSF